MSHARSAALPTAYVVLRILVVLNALAAAAIIALLLFMPTERWIMAEFKLSPSPQAERLVIGLHALAILCLVALGLGHLVLKRLLAIVDTVRVGDPFVAENASRLRTIAWLMLAGQLISLLIAGIGEAISPPGRPVDLDAGLSIPGWLAVILTFVLASVFEEGARMRDDLEGTI